MIEVNISCPNVENRGQVFACDAIASSRVIGAVRRAADPAQPVFAKLSPDVTDITLIARACADAGADGFSLINTLLGLVIDTDTMRAGARRRDRRAVRPGDPAGRGALRVAGARRRCRTCRSSAWAASAPASTRCEFVLAGASAVSVGHRGVRRPDARRCGCSPNSRPRSTSAASPRVRRRGRLRAPRRARPRRRADQRALRRRPRHDLRRSGLDAALDDARLAVRRHRPASRAARGVGAAPTTSTGWPGSPTSASTAFADTAAVIKPQSAFFERVRLARDRRAGADRRRLPRRRRAGRARRQARRHRHDDGRLRARLPRPVRAAGRRRDHRQPVPRRRLAANRPSSWPSGTTPACSCSPLTSNPEGPQVQHARTADGRIVAQAVLDELAARNAGAAPFGSLGVVVGRHHRRRPRARLDAAERAVPGPGHRRPGRHRRRRAADLRCRAARGRAERVARGAAARARRRGAARRP